MPDFFNDLEHDPIFEPLRSDPRFQVIVQEIRFGMAAQLEQVRSKGYDEGICSKKWDGAN